MNCPASRRKPPRSAASHNLLKPCPSLARWNGSRRRRTRAEPSGGIVYEPADTRECPECRGNPRLLCRGTSSSNPSPSRGEKLWGGRRGWQFRRLHQSMECRDAPVERFEQVLVEPPSSRRGNLRSCSTVRLLDTPLAHRSSAASRRRDERIKRQRSPKGDQERFVRQNEWLSRGWKRPAPSVLRSRSPPACAQ